MTALDEFLQLCSAEITRRAHAADHKQPELLSGAYAFEQALAGASVTQTELSVVPVLDCLPASQPSELASIALNAAAELPWVPTPRMTDGGTQAALALVDKVRALGDLICGIMLLGPGCSYPEHSHPPQEIYLPIIDDGRWRFGGSESYQQLGPNELVYNHPGDVHGAHAPPDAPVLALYILWP